MEDVFNNFDIGSRLRQIRLGKSLSQEQVANMANITTAYLGQVERGAKNVTVYTLEKICNALSVSLTEFFNANITKPISDIPAQVLSILNELSESEQQHILQVIKTMVSFQKHPYAYNESKYKTVIFGAKVDKDKV